MKRMVVFGEKCVIIETRHKICQRKEFSFMKKLVSLMLFAALIINISLPVNVAKASEEEANEIHLYSPEFQDAYITEEYYDCSNGEFSIENGNATFINQKSKSNTDEINLLISSNDDLNDYIVNTENTADTIKAIVSGTAVVEEIYDIINGEQICIASRLLSEEDIKSDYELRNTRLSGGSETTTKSKGNVTLTFIVFDVSSSSSYATCYDLCGIAEYTLNASTSGYYYPSAGEDFFGFAWGGSYAQKNASSMGMYPSGSSTSFAPSVSEPNKAVGWSYNEKLTSSSPSAYVTTYNYVSGEVTLYKNKLSSQNETSFNFSYIHTYSSNQYSFSLSSGLSFSCSPASSSWSMVAIVDEIPY